MQSMEAVAAWWKQEVASWKEAAKKSLDKSLGSFHLGGLLAPLDELSTEGQGSSEIGGSVSGSGPGRSEAGIVRGGDRVATKQKVTIL